MLVLCGEGIKMPCLARLVCSDYKLPFGDGKHYFYLESACGAGCEETICDKCVKKISGPGRDTLWHGLVNEAYTKKSHIFDSPWYHSKVGTYGQPTREILEQAMQAQMKARQGKHVSISTAITNKPEKSHDPPAVVSPGQTHVMPPVKKGPTKNKQKISVAEQLVESTITAIPIAVKYVENEDELLEVSEIRKINLVVFTHNGRDYWRDKDGESVWEKTQKGQRGAFIGTWKKEVEEIECV
jgi:hypothetical protein